MIKFVLDLNWEYHPLISSANNSSVMYCNYSIQLWGSTEPINKFLRAVGNAYRHASNVEEQQYLDIKTVGGVIREFAMNHERMNLSTLHKM